MPKLPSVVPPEQTIQIAGTDSNDLPPPSDQREVEHTAEIGKESPVEQPVQRGERIKLFSDIVLSAATVMLGIATCVLAWATISLVKSDDHHQQSEWQREVDRSIESLSDHLNALPSNLPCMRYSLRPGGSPNSELSSPMMDSMFYKDEPPFDKIDQDLKSADPELIKCLSGLTQSHPEININNISREARYIFIRSQVTGYYNIVNAFSELTSDAEGPAAEKSRQEFIEVTSNPADRNLFHYALVRDAQKSSDKLLGPVEVTNFMGSVFSFCNPTHGGGPLLDCEALAGKDVLAVGLAKEKARKDLAKKGQDTGSKGQ